MRNTELCNQIITAITAKPKQIDMADSIYQVDRCGTVGCIAGWACLIDDARAWNERARSMPINNDMKHASVSWTSVELRAYELLGPSLDSRNGALDDLFYTQYWPKRFREQLMDLKQGTAEYADTVALRLAHWRDTGDPT